MRSLKNSFPIFVAILLLFQTFCKSAPQSKVNRPVTKSVASADAKSFNNTSESAATPASDSVTPTIVAEEPENTEVQATPCKKPLHNMQCIVAGKVNIVEKKANTELEGKVEVDTFYIDKYEVINSNYSLCSRSGKCDRISRKVSRTLKAPKQPAILSWKMAFQYCRWQGKRLPSEAEWQLAAQVDDDAKYPWGEEKPSCEKSNYRSCAAITLAVGSKPANANKLYDLSGNASEWVNDWASDCRLNSCKRSCGKACTGKNPQGPCSGKFRCKSRQKKIIKGGNYLSKPEELTINHRQALAYSKSKYTTARCATSHNYSYRGPAWMIKRPLPTPAATASPTKVQLQFMHNLQVDTLNKPFCDKPYTSPAHCRDPVSYVMGNETRHQLFLPYIKNLGGGYVGVAADGNYSFVSYAKSRWVWLMDFDINITRLHKFIKAFVKANPKRRGFVKMFAYRSRHKARRLINAEFKGDPDVAFIYGVYKRYRGQLLPYYKRKLRPSSRLRKFGWLRNDTNYTYIRTLYNQGRIAIVPGDLLKNKSLRSIGAAAKKLGTKIRLYYPSNAEEFWRYSDDYKKNVLSLPFDEASIAIRTIHEYPWHPKGRGFAGFWHYVVHGGLAYQEYLRRDDFRFMNDWKEYRIVPTKYRDFSTIHLPNQIPDHIRNKGKLTEDNTMN